MHGMGGDEKTALWDLSEWGMNNGRDSRNLLLCHVRLAYRGNATRIL